MKRIINCLVVSLVCLSVVLSCRQDEETSVEPVFEQVTESITADPEGGHYEIVYKLDNPVEEYEVEASSEQDWIGDFTYGDGKVAFAVAANTGESKRSGSVRVSYGTGGLGFEVSVEQLSKEDEPQAEYDVDVECDVFHGAYWGNAYSGDRYGYAVHLATDRSYLDSGVPDIDGVYYIIELYGPEPDDMNDIFLPAGTYMIDKENTYGDYTVLAGELEDGVIAGTIYCNQKKLNFESGVIVVTREGSDNICDIDMVATLSDGTVHHMEFRGMDLFLDGSIKWIKNDVSMGDIQYFQATYLPDKYRNANLNIKMTDAPLTENGYLVYPGNVLTFVGNVEIMDNGMPKPGVWTVSSEENLPVNTLWQGECVRFGSPFPVGVCVESYDADGNVTVGLADRGTVTVSGGGDNYVMTWDIVTRNRKKITGTYIGPVVVAGAPIVDTTLLDSDYEVQLDNLTVTSCYYSSWSGDLKIDLAYMHPETFDYIGDNMRIRIIPKVGVTGPEPGIYKVSATNEPGCVVAGSFDIENPVWSLYLEFDENGEIVRGAAVRDGEMEMIKNNDGTWTINFDFLDAQADPKRFYGSWTGTLYDLGDNPW